MYIYAHHMCDLDVTGLPASIALSQLALPPQQRLSSSYAHRLTLRMSTTTEGFEGPIILVAHVITFIVLLLSSADYLLALLSYTLKVMQTQTKLKFFLRPLVRAQIRKPNLIALPSE